MKIKQLRSAELKYLMRRNKRTHCSHCNRPLSYVWIRGLSPEAPRMRMGAYLCTQCDTPRHFKPGGPVA